MARAESNLAARGYKVAINYRSRASQASIWRV